MRLSVPVCRIEEDFGEPSFSALPNSSPAVWLPSHGEVLLASGFGRESLSVSPFKFWGI